MTETMDEEARMTTTVWNEAAVAEPAAPVETPDEKKPPKEKEDVEDIEKRARKPPSDGPCKGCGENKPLNRLMLCYRCWVNKNLTDADKDFIPGIDPHPATCGCTLPEHGGKNGGPRPSN